jgi:hypothetical protein
MLDAGADAVCPEEPEYWADAGYEAAFRQLYEARLGRPWQPPDESHAARWTADRLKAQLMTEAVHAILNAARARKPTAKRMVALHSPLNYALWRICLAHHALIFGDGFPDLPPSFRFPPLREGNQAGAGSVPPAREGNQAGAGSVPPAREGNQAGASSVPPAGRGNLKEGVVNEVIGQVWSDTVRTPLPSDGEYQAEPFATAYLEYASLAGLLRESGKRLWFLCDPLSDVPNRPLEEHQQFYFNTLVASLMFPEATGYEVLPWPERIFGNVPAEYATVILSAARACEAIAQTGATLDAGAEGIGMLFSDSMTAVRGAPEVAPVEDMLALGIPLVNAGIPLTMHSLQRLPERALPRSLRLLLWTPETVKPLREAELRALAEWVQGGGWLVCRRRRERLRRHPRHAVAAGRTADAHPLAAADARQTADAGDRPARACSARSVAHARRSRH